MSELNLNPIKAIGDSLSKVLNSFDEIITSKEERMDKDNELAKVRNDLAEIQRDMYNKTAEVEVGLNQAKSQILQAEVNGNRLQRMWRPILMLCFGFIIIYQYFLVHLINVIYAAAHGPDEVLLQSFEMSDRFWTLLEIGIGGYIAGRSLEKITPNLAKTILEQKESRRMTEEVKAKQEARDQRQERRQERWERRQDRKDARLEAKLIEKDLVMTDAPDEALTKKEERQKRRQERRQRGKGLMGKLFKS